MREAELGNQPLITAAQDQDDAAQTREPQFQGAPDEVECGKGESEGGERGKEMRRERREREQKVSRDIKKRERQRERR